MFRKSALQGTGPHRAVCRKAQAFKGVALRCEKTSTSFSTSGALAAAFVLLEFVHGIQPQVPAQGARPGLYLEDRASILGQSKKSVASLQVEARFTSSK